MELIIVVVGSEVKGKLIFLNNNCPKRTIQELKRKTRSYMTRRLKEEFFCEGYNYCCYYQLIPINF